MTFTFSFFFCPVSHKNFDTAMFEVEEAVLIGPIVAVFLFNSGRIRKAVEILKECLVVLEEKAFKGGNELFKLMYEELLFEVFEWCLSLNDFTNAVGMW